MILALRALGVGDLATAVPALRALRAAYPRRELVLATPGWLGPLVDLVGGVDRIVPTDGLDQPIPVSGRPELAVNLHGRGPRSHRRLAATGPARLLAHRCPAAGHPDGPPWRADDHEVDRWCRLLGWYGIPADPTDLDLTRPDPERTPAGVSIVHPGSKEPAKRWPPDRFAAVARELTGRGHRVVLTGSADERSLAGRVAAAAGLPEAAVLAGRTDVGELAALVAHARLVVSGDTGVAHLATAYRTPSVVLFGPVPPARWGPPADRPWHRALWAGDRTPAPSAATGRRYDQDWPKMSGVERPPYGDAAGPGHGLTGLGVAEVLTAVDEVEQVVRSTGAVEA
ncbi:glycosyltransferase family 9 protein [Micromonospora echinofusca]|uniref:Glycosyltransferase family 9 protein n=1 Tax=Micromonospora echinofusca TaxID=47858 RepID=A0ABS3VYJ1_MICEH|nr:glycosyltransferase family 9 protein [Micromonospora echinofusca]MBO4209604.1 glycosyltransferase family 9 protein [Micromonospora echinofusca]